MMLAILLGSILFLYVIHCFQKYGRVGRLISLIPGPKEYPFIGNTYYFFYGTNERLLETLWKFCNEYYSIFKLRNIFYKVIILLDPEDIQILLKSNKYIEKGLIYEVIKPWLSTGLLTSYGQKWHMRRKILTPAFHFGILKHYFIILNKVSRSFVESLKKETDGNPVVKDLRKFISQYTLNAICQTTLGVELTGKNELESEYHDAVRNYGKLVAARHTKPWYFIGITYQCTSLARQQKKWLKTLHNFSRKIIDERKHFHEQTGGKYLQILKNIKEDDVFDKDLESKKTLSLLDLLIALSRNDNLIDDEGIQEEVDTFMFEGHDTTASAVCSALSLFAKHKDVQANIRNEINMIMQEDNNFTILSLQKLEYLERCLKETLRLYPSVHLIIRNITCDLQLKDYLIPSGTDLQVNIYALHRNPKYWPNPNIFNPDRFLPENIKGRHPYSYIPFSAGPRNCIGQKFAMLELKLIVSYILHNFELEPVDELDDIVFSADLTLNSSKPFRVKFIPIT